MNSEILKNITSNKEDSLLYCMHLPKSGGSHITKLIGNKIGFINGGHQFCIDNIPHNSYNPWTKKGIKVFSNYLYDKNFRRSVTFAVVRNPFDWLSSYFFHWSGEYNRNTEHRGWAGSVDFHGFNSWREFVISYCSEDFFWHCPPLQKFMISPLFDVNGKCRADFILFNEILDKTLPVVAKHFCLDYKSDVEYKHTRKNIFKPSRNDLYDEELANMVATKFERELELFGYSKDGWDDSKIQLPFDGVVCDPSSLRYRIEEDKMELLQSIELNSQNDIDIIYKPEPSNKRRKWFRSRFGFFNIARELAKRMDVFLLNLKDRFLAVLR